MKNYHDPVRVPDPIRFVWFVLIMLGALLVIHGCSGMDRWAALSMIESGDNDYAVGKSGEVSRYQISKQDWVKYSIDVRRQSDDSFFLKISPINKQDAHMVAMLVMLDNYQQIKPTYPFGISDEGKLLPNDISDYQFALLWHCPGRLQSHALTASDCDYAQRFYNLVHKEEIERHRQ